MVTHRYLIINNFWLG